MGRVPDFLRLSFAVASLHGAAEAFWRLPCRGRLGVGQVDPIVDFEKVSSHVHSLHGGNKLSLDNKPQDLLSSDCSSCGVKQDKSAYWTPSLYFMHEDGTAELVDQIGGMLAYYLLYANADEKLVSFPPGFQMIAGDPSRRNFTCKVPEPPKSSWSGFEVSQEGLSQKALGFNCLHYQSDGQGTTQPEASLGRHYLPDKSFLDTHCTSGIRLELFFPSCWDGKHATSSDHKSHMAYPSLVNGGECPKSHPKRTASLFFETIWNTYAFKGKKGEFVVSNGDPTGFGYHGDFQFAWEGDTLQQALQTCTNPSGNVQDCPLFHLTDESEMQKCKMDLPSPLKGIDCEKSKGGLPGKNPIERGPEPAKKHGPSSPAPAKEAPKPKPKPHYEGSKPEARPKHHKPHREEPKPKAKPHGQPNATQKPKKVADAYGGGKNFANPDPTPPAKHAAGGRAQEGSGGAVEVQAAAAEGAGKEEKKPGPKHVEHHHHDHHHNDKKKKGKILSTSTVTKDGAIWDIVVEQETEKVTADTPEETATALEKYKPHYKRHLHQHVHNHAHVR